MDILKLAITLFLTGVFASLYVPINEVPMVVVVVAAVLIIIFDWLHPLFKRVLWWVGVCR